MKIERKISFVVAGIEFQNLKVAQFFKRAMELETQYLSSDAKSKFDADSELLEHWYTMLSYSRSMVDPETVVSTIMSLQLPKPARKPTPKKKKVTTMAEVLDLKKKNVQVLAGDPQTKNQFTKNQFLEPTLDEQEEILSAGLTD